MKYMILTMDRPCTKESAFIITADRWRNFTSQIDRSVARWQRRKDAGGVGIASVPPLRYVRQDGSRNIVSRIVIIVIDETAIRDFISELAALSAGANYVRPLTYWIVGDWHEPLEMYRDITDQGVANDLS